MKYVMIVGDGMADFPIEALGGKTPLGSLRLPGFERIGAGQLGRLLSCPDGLPPGSDVAFLSLFGHDPLRCYNGRSPLEAAGLGVSMRPGEVAFRLNLAAISGEGYPNAAMLSHNGGGIEGQEALTLIHALMRDEAFSALMRECGLRIVPTDSFRHVAIMPGSMSDFDLTPPHDIVGQPVRAHLPMGKGGPIVLRLMQASFAALNAHPINESRRQRGLLPANTAWLWGAGAAYNLSDFEEMYQKKGTVISAVPLVKGLAVLSGLEAPEVEGATGLLDTNYEGKVGAALHALRGGSDFALLHLEAPDEMSHDGDLKSKLEAISRLNERVVEPLLAALPALGDHRVLLLPDHYTLLSTRTHDATPVPFALYDSRIHQGARPFTEQACETAPLFTSGDALLRLLFAAG